MSTIHAMIQLMRSLRDLGSYYCLPHKRKVDASGSQSPLRSRVSYKHISARANSHRSAWVNHTPHWRDARGTRWTQQTRQHQKFSTYSSICITKCNDVRVRAKARAWTRKIAASDKNLKVGKAIGTSHLRREKPPRTEGTHTSHHDPNVDPTITRKKDHRSGPENGNKT